MQDTPALTLFDDISFRAPSATKACTGCNLVLPVEDFYLKDRKPGERRSRCKACHNKRAAGRPAWRDGNRDRDNELQRLRYQKNPQKWMPADLRRRAKEYGLDVEEVVAHFRAHNGLCDICGQPPADRDETRRKARRLCIDHDHLTGKFRGLLCRPCNLALGNMNDNPKWLIEAAHYLERHLE